MCTYSGACPQTRVGRGLVAVLGARQRERMQHGRQDVRQSSPGPVASRPAPCMARHAPVASALPNRPHLCLRCLPVVAVRVDHHAREVAAVAHERRLPPLAVVVRHQGQEDERRARVWRRQLGRLGGDPPVLRVAVARQQGGRRLWRRRGAGEARSLPERQGQNPSKRQRRHMRRMQCMRARIHACMAAAHGRAGPPR
jgi:hypothetical protein